MVALSSGLAKVLCDDGTGVVDFGLRGEIWIGGFEASHGVIESSPEFEVKMRGIKFEARSTSLFGAAMLLAASILAVCAVPPTVLTFCLMGGLRTVAVKPDGIYFGS